MLHIDKFLFKKSQCGKGTDFSYGPWADRQREHLFKFFFPQDYQGLKVLRILFIMPVFVFYF